MAECGEISLMLGAFEDSELEPNEMQEVAFHLARCESCTGILADYSTLGRDLRSVAAEPSLAGFSNAVIARVDRLPQPVLARIERFIRRQWDSVGSGIAWGGAVAAAAIMTIILMTPYAEQFANRSAKSNTSVAAVEPGVPAANQVAQATANEPTMADNNSHADISRLE
ncbi:MAG: zf-HC2 domain-containing protein, partial [Candidatus Binatus sp.]